MKKTIALASLLALAVGASAAHAAKFYKWTDDKGVTHYTIDPPPAGAKSSEVRIKTQSYSDAEETMPPAPGTPKGKPAGAGKAAPSKAKPETGTAKDAGKKEEKAVPPAPERYAERCKTLRTNLATIQAHAQVRETDDKGETRMLSSEEKSARTEDLQREIKAYCE
jgi:hypothetical protein